MNICDVQSEQLS